MMISYCEALVVFKHGYTAEIELTNLERFCTASLHHVKDFQKTILAYSQQCIWLAFQMNSSVYLAK